MELECQDSVVHPLKHFQYMIDDKVLLMTCFNESGNKCYDSRISLKIVKKVIMTVEKESELKAEVDVLRNIDNYYPPNKPSKKIEVREDEITLKEVISTAGSSQQTGRHLDFYRV